MTANIEKKPAIIVTGGSAGIGAAIVKMLADEPYTIINCDITRPQFSQPEQYRQVDLTDPIAIENLFSALDLEYVIVGLVNNAGFAISHALEETTPADFERLTPLNIVGPTLCAKYASRSMKKAGWGRIVNISSRAALGKTNRSAYAATKGAITSLTRVWALELAPHNISVNTVGPGPIATDLFLKVNPTDSPKTRALVASIPMQRVGSSEDIASAVKFFLDKRNGYVTGQTLYVCGGLTVGVAPT